MVPEKMADHVITNFDELLSKAIDSTDRKTRRIALTLLEEAVRAADPRTAIRNHVSLDRNAKTLRVGNEAFNLDKFHRIFVIGAGKASGAMTEGIEGLLGKKVIEGSVSILRGTKGMFNTKIIRLCEASHPIPGNDSIEATERILNIVDKTTPEDLILGLFSGGGSSLFSLPEPKVNLDDFQKTIIQLLKRGATINELNAVRKHLSRVSGGRLAERVAQKGCTMVVLVISDVVGDPLDVVAGGPTAPDTTTFRDAIEVLKHYNLWDDTSESIRQHLQMGLAGQFSETPKQGSNVFNHVHNFVIGSCRQACYAAHRKAQELGFKSIVLSTMVEGEAREVGKVLAGIAKELTKYDSPIKRPAAVIMGGETTVTVQGEGKGGRNQELVLSASKQIDGISQIAVASMETDGIDGPTDAAGAIATGFTLTKARMKELITDEYMARNDSNTFFKDLDDGLIITGPTGTNVNDIMVVLAT